MCDNIEKKCCVLTLLTRVILSLLNIFNNIKLFVAVDWEQITIFNQCAVNLYKSFDEQWVSTTSPVNHSIWSVGLIFF